MNKVLAYDHGLSKFQPLDTILAYDDFDNGFNGWVDLKPNFNEQNFEARKSIVEKTQWGPIMLSSASYGQVGTHGSMNGTYSLKLATRPVAAPYEEPPAAGSMSHAIKRLSFHKKKGLTQFEMWYAYTPEMDRIGLSENTIRAMGFFFDIQDDEYRYFVGARYLNAVNGKMDQRWQICQAEDMSNEEWAYGTSGDWCIRGIDPIWYGPRHTDGSAAGFAFVKDGYQKLCYNESNDKINWLYFRLLVDTEKREYVELQSESKVFDLRGIKPTLVKPYARIDELLNPSVWIEADTDRRVFMYVDSCVVSVE